MQSRKPSIAVGIDLAGSVRRPTGVCVLHGMRAETCIAFSDEKILQTFETYFLYFLWRGPKDFNRCIRSAHFGRGREEEAIQLRNEKASSRAPRRWNVGQYMKFATRECENVDRG